MPGDGRSRVAGATFRKSMPRARTVRRGTWNALLAADRLGDPARSLRRVSPRRRDLAVAARAQWRRRLPAGPGGRAAGAGGAVARQTGASEVSRPGRGRERPVSLRLTGRCPHASARRRSCAGSGTGAGTVRTDQACAACKDCSGRGSRAHRHGPHRGQHLLCGFVTALSSGRKSTDAFRTRGAAPCPCRRWPIGGDRGRRPWRRRRRR